MNLLPHGVEEGAVFRQSFRTHIALPGAVIGGRRDELLLLRGAEEKREIRAGGLELQLMLNCLWKFGFEGQEEALQFSRFNGLRGLDHRVVTLRTGGGFEFVACGVDETLDRRIVECPQRPGEKKPFGNQIEQKEQQDGQPEREKTFPEILQLIQKWSRFHEHPLLPKHLFVPAGQLRFNSPINYYSSFLPKCKKMLFFSDTFSKIEVKREKTGKINENVFLFL